MDQSIANFQSSRNHGVQLAKNTGTINVHFSEDETKERQKCHQLFRLTTSSEDTTYERYKNQVAERVEGTCEWFLEHDHFKRWLEQVSGPLLVTADPGCGKSVLAKYLIDKGLPQSATICYFFFKDQDQHTVRQALCALIHQLFSKDLSLIRHALPEFRNDGDRLIHSTESLWRVLRSIIKDPQVGSIFIVLDALDECAELELADLVQNIESQFSSNYFGNSRLKYLLTCRPYNKIVSKFYRLLDHFPNIHIPGEEESERISKEVNSVIESRVNQLAKAKDLTYSLKKHLQERLQKTTNRTYLWVYLVFKNLEEEDFRKTFKGLESIITTLPRSVYEAYEQILNKSSKNLIIQKVFRIMLAATRPLTLSEMNIALTIDDTLSSLDGLDLEDEKDFKMNLRSWCGLFVSVNHGHIYFLHQTAREFLLADSLSPTTTLPELRWHHSITLRDAHAVLAKICVIYLSLFNSDASLSAHTDNHAFLDYSAKTWGAHFRDAIIIDNDAIIPFAMKICDPDSKCYLAWFEKYWSATGFTKTYLTNILVPSYYGHPAVVKEMLKRGANVEEKDTDFGRSPLSWAARFGDVAVISLLLEKGADIEAHGTYEGKTPLCWAVSEGHKAVVKLLLDNGANVEGGGDDNWTPLQIAAMCGHEAIFKMLLNKGANIEAEGGFETGALRGAAKGGHEAIVKLLLDDGANIEARDSFMRQTALHSAAGRGHKAIVKLLLDKGADVHARDVVGSTALYEAAQFGHVAVVKLLLAKGADIEAKDIDGQTPLFRAATYEHETVVKLLIDNGADVNAKDDSSRTPLFGAALNCHNPSIMLLLRPAVDAAIGGRREWVRRRRNAARQGRRRRGQSGSQHSRTPVQWAGRHDKHDPWPRWLQKR